MSFADDVKEKRAAMLDEEIRKNTSVRKITNEEVFGYVCESLYEQLKNKIIEEVSVENGNEGIAGSFDLPPIYQIRVDDSYGRGVENKTTEMYRMSFQQADWEHDEGWTISCRFVEVERKVGIAYNTIKVALTPAGKKLIQALTELAHNDDFSVSFEPIALSTNGKIQLLTSFDKNEPLHKDMYNARNGTIRLSYVF